MVRSDLPDAGLPPAFMDDGPSGTMSAMEEDGDDGGWSCRTHDQLPTPEQYKAEGTVSSKLNQGNRVVKLYLASLLTIILLIILIAGTSSAVEIMPTTQSISLRSCCHVGQPT
jgi:hypothetical protein